MQSSKPGKIELFVFLLGLAAALWWLYYTGPSITGFVIKEYSYEDKLSLVVASSGNYSWELENAGSLRYARISGKVTNYGRARVYLESNGMRYLVFDSLSLNISKSAANETNRITGFAAKGANEEDKEKGKGKEKKEKNETEDAEVNETISNGTISNETLPEDTILNETIINETRSINDSININPEINETAIPIINGTSQNITNATEPIGSSIKISLQYQEGSVYDENNDGIEPVTGVIDLAVGESDFNFVHDGSRLCTRWEVYSIGDGTLTEFCSGNKDCCAFAGLLPRAENWSDAYYAAFGKDGAGHDNIISAQLIYYDVNLSPESPKSEIYYSEWGNLSAKFTDEEAEFSGICAETCSIDGLNKSSYALVFEMEGNAVLRIDSIKYGLLADSVNTPPVLLKNISEIRISKGRSAIINLSEHFSDADGDALSYSYYKPDNAAIIFNGNTAVVIAEEAAEGAGFSFITANDSESSVISNVFMINITPEEGPGQEVHFFEIKGNSGKKLAVFDSLGNLEIAGVLLEDDEPIVDSNDFAVQNRQGSANAVVKNPEGDLIIKGKLADRQKELLPTPESFIIQDKNNAAVAYFNSTGSLFIKGSLSQSRLFE